jgi:hypothetical protein
MLVYFSARPLRYNQLREGAQPESGVFGQFNGLGRFGKESMDMAADENNSAATGRDEGQEERLPATGSSVVSTNGTAASYPVNGSSSGDVRLPGAAADSDDEDVDVAMALMALEARGDMGEPTADLDLSSLSDADKRMLLAMLRKRLGLTETGSSSRDAAGGAARRNP